jgi:DNA-binding IclR family transcriptional regulator
MVDLIRIRSREGSNLSETARPGTKKALLIEMLTRPGGSTIGGLADATGWKPNTVHSAFATMRRQGLEVTSMMAEGGRRYRLER